MLAFETKKDHVELPLCEHTHTHSNHLQILNVVDVQSLSCVQLFVTSQTIACQAPLSSTLSWSLLKFIESLMVSHHLILCHSLLRLSSIFSTSGSFPMTQLFTTGGQSIGASASASVLRVNIQGWFPLGFTDLSRCCPRDSQESSLTPQFESISSLALSLLYGPILTSIHDYWKNHSFDYMHVFGQVDASPF